MHACAQTLPALPCCLRTCTPAWLRLQEAKKDMLKVAGFGWLACAATHMYNVQVLLSDPGCWFGGLLRAASSAPLHWPGDGLQLPWTG